MDIPGMEGGMLHINLEALFQPDMWNWLPKYLVLYSALSEPGPQESVNARLGHPDGAARNSVLWALLRRETQRLAVEPWRAISWSELIFYKIWDDNSVLGSATPI